MRQVEIFMMLMSYDKIEVVWNTIAYQFTVECDTVGSWLAVNNMYRMWYSNEIVVSMSSSGFPLWHNVIFTMVSL